MKSLKVINILNELISDLGYQTRLAANYNQALTEIDKKLIIGSILFGAGWGLVGLCPGPAISSLALLNNYSLAFIISMFLGFLLVTSKILFTISPIVIDDPYPRLYGLIDSPFSNTNNAPFTTSLT